MAEIHGNSSTRRSPIKAIPLFLLLVLAVLAPAPSALAMPDALVPGDLDWDTSYAIPGAGNPGPHLGPYPYQGAGSGVYAILPTTDGSVYLGGAFTLASGQAVRNVARFDGARFWSLGGGLPCPVRALAKSPSGALYAACAAVNENYTDEQGVTKEMPVAHVYRLNGDAWQSLASLTSVSSQQEVAPDANDMVFDSLGNLYVGGFYGLLDNQVYGGIARYDGSAWHKVGDGTGGGAIYDLELVNDNYLIASGGFASINNVYGTRGVAYWNGLAWSAFDYGPAGANAYVAYSGGYVYLNNTMGTYQWDGQKWNDITVPGYPGMKTPGPIIRLPDGSLLAAYDLRNGSDNYSLMRYSGGSWSLFASGKVVDGDNPIVAMVAIPGGGLYLGGEFTQFGGKTADNVIYYNGQWQPLGEGEAANPGVSWIKKIGFGLDGTMYIASANQVWSWDGTTLVPLGPDIPDVYGQAGISDMVVDPSGAVYIGGDFTELGQNGVSYLARWNSETSAWETVGGGVDGKVNDLELDPRGALYVGGDFTHIAGSLLVTGVARWETWGEWSVLYGDPGCPGPFTNYCPVYSLAWDKKDAQLYIRGWIYPSNGPSDPGSGWGYWTWSPSGGFNTFDMPNMNCGAPMKVDKLGGLWMACTSSDSPGKLARWSGSSYDYYPTDSGVDGIERDGQGNLYLYGTFDSINNIALSHVARWDGSSFTSLGSGLSDAPFALGIDPLDRVIVGGDYVRGAGSRRVNGWARYAPGIPSPAIVRLNYVTGSPGSIFTLSGANFLPNARATVWLGGKALGTVTTDANGSLFAQLDGAQARPGVYTLVVTQYASARAGLTIDTSAPVRPSEANYPTLALPNTPPLDFRTFVPLLNR